MHTRLVISRVFEVDDKMCDFFFSCESCEGCFTLALVLLFKTEFLVEQISLCTPSLCSVHHQRQKEISQQKPHDEVRKNEELIKIYVKEKR